MIEEAQEGTPTIRSFVGGARMAVARNGLAGCIAAVGVRPIGLALVWLVAMSAALLLGDLGPTAAPLIAATGALLMLTSVHVTPPRRAAAVLAMVPGAFADSAPGWSWVIAGALIAGAVAAQSDAIIVRGHDLARHIDRCRRRQEKAHVLLMRVPARAVPRPVSLLEEFRLTDSVALTCARGVCELQAVIDDHEFSRLGLELRIASDTGAKPSFGWATFPDDGVTLAVLQASARRALDMEKCNVLGSSLFEESYASA